MNSTDKMKALMKEYFGITVPMLYYQNHEPIECWYDSDSDKNSLCAKCGVEITVNLSEDEFTKKKVCICCMKMTGIGNSLCSWKILDELPNLSSIGSHHKRQRTRPHPRYGKMFVHIRTIRLGKHYCK